MTTQQVQEEFFLRELGPLAGWAGALVGDADAGRDLAADAFVRLLPRWSRVQDRRGYLYVSVANAVRDRWRRQATRTRTAHLLRPTAVAPEGPPR